MVAANDVWRWLPNPKPAFSKEQMKNLKALSSMANENRPHERKEVFFTFFSQELMEL